VDLGKSSERTAACWQEIAGCPVLRLQSFRRSVEDPRLAGQIFRSGFGQLQDQQGLDWWQLTSVSIHSDLETAISLQRLAANADLSGELHATRSDWPVEGLALLLGRPVRAFGDTVPARATEPLRHFARAFGKLRLAQVIEIFWDKYDAGYQWRSRVTPSQNRSSRPVVLLPSAYTNVSRTASAYARVLPEQQFLLVATRDSGMRFERPTNVRVARLAAYAQRGGRRSETASILQGWAELRMQLERIPEVALLARIGLLEPFARLFKDGLAARDAWQAVFDREPVTAVMCGDDTNWYTRIPVLLARKRNLPTIDFHHGAFDGRFLLKDLSSDVYLAKNEMERDYLTRICSLPPKRVIVGGPGVASVSNTNADRRDRSKIVFFSEPYESAGGRPEEIYRELLPALSRMARDHGRSLVLKLHPFENPEERSRLVEAALGADAGGKIEIVEGALSLDLLASTWFGITVESSTVVDCSKNAVPCFQCEWLVSSPWAYVQQFARFGVGRLLRSPDELAEIPSILAEGDRPAVRADALDSPITAEALLQLFSGRVAPLSDASPSR
jgi:hypothetical protein